MARPVALRSPTASFIAGVVLAAALASCSQTRAVSPEGQVALADWLVKGCAVQDSQVEEGLRKFGGELETPLIELFESGPAPAEIRLVETAARTQFERTKSLINSGFPTGLPANDVEALRMASSDEWAKRSGEDFVMRRRLDALAGLSLIGGSKGRRLLEQIAADPNSPFNEEARLATSGDSPATKR